MDLWLGDVTETSSLLVELFLVDEAWATSAPLPRLTPAGRDAVLPGGLRLSDGRAILITASDAPATIGSVALPRIEWAHEDLEAAERAAERGDLRMMIFGAMADGALGLIDLQAPPDVDIDRMASNPRRRSVDE